jgi:dihydropyrimidinase
VPQTVDTLIVGGRVFLDGGLHETSLAIGDGVVAGYGPPPAFSSAETIDAHGAYLLPGVVDPHMHLACVFSDDDFATASKSAAFGGVTTMLDFTFQEKGKLPSDAFREKAAIGERESYVDFSFHCALTQENHQTIRDVGELLRAGTTNSFKFFMAYDFNVSTGFMHDALAEIGRNGGIGMVHAEDPSVINYRVRDFQERDCCAPTYFPEAHPAFSEETAVYTAIAVAREARARLYVVHVTTKEGSALIRRARADGLPIYGETCPHYLTVTRDEYGRTGSLGIMCPPLREEADAAALWDAIGQGGLDCIGTDHAAFRRSRKIPGDEQFWRSPFGAPGVEAVLPILHEHGVRRGRLPLARMVELMCEAPARLYGCPTKGSLAPGKDADVVVFDPAMTVELRAEDMHTGSDYTLYEGWKVTGWPRSTMVRGRFVVRDGQLVGHPGFGRSIPRGAALDRLPALT